MELPVIQGIGRPGAEDDAPILGIDLGTTHSLVAVYRDGRPEVLCDEDGEALLPSVVSFPADGGAPVVGSEARRRAELEPERTVHSAKRLVGRSAADLGETLASLPYRVVDADGEMAVVDLGERTVSPQEVAAHVLRACRRRAARALGLDEARLTRAVVTVPAYFDDAQRQATRVAARLAGLEVVRMVNEPTAAALAYGLDRKGASRVAVYDLGGGTFDVSVLELDDGTFRVVATAGDTHLGGDDFDRAIVEHVASEVREEHGVDLLAEPAARIALLHVAEEVKKELSRSDVAEFRFHDSASGLLVRRPIGVIEFQNWIAPLVQRTLDLAARALADAGLTTSDLDEVVLVGGSTRVPLVRAAVEQWFGRVPHARLDPDQVVALGAAVQAGVLGGKVPGALLLDVTPLTLGIETADGAVAALIPRNSPIPTSAGETFTTFVDGQTAIELTVVQGEREMARDNRVLGRFQLRGLPPLPAGLPRVEVRFQLDADGVLRVHARETHSDVEAEITVEPRHGLTDEAVERMLEEAWTHAEEDLEARRRADALLRLQTDVRSVEKHLGEARRGLDKDALIRLEEALEDAQDLLEETAAGEVPPPQRVQGVVDELEAAALPLAELLMDRVVTTAVQGRTVEEVAAEPVPPAPQDEGNAS